MRDVGFAARRIQPLSLGQNQIGHAAIDRLGLRSDGGPPAGSTARDIPAQRTAGSAVSATFTSSDFVGSCGIGSELRPVVQCLLEPRHHPVHLALRLTDYPGGAVAIVLGVL
jgi:hypothetical protein